MKNFHFNSICNNTQETQELQRCNNDCEFVGKSGLIKYHHLLSKVKNICGKSHLDQLATASSSTSP